MSGELFLHPLGKCNDILAATTMLDTVLDRAVHDYVDDEVASAVSDGRELWRAVPGYDGYEVSTLGRVRSMDRVITQGTRWGAPMQHTRKGRLLVPMPTDRGRFQVGLGRGIGGTKRLMIHRVVALTFLPNPENKETINHKDGNKQNNSAANLEWATMSEQHVHRCRVLEQDLGEDNRQAKLTWDDVDEIRALRAFGAFSTRLAEAYGVSQPTISKILRGESWTQRPKCR